MTGLSVAGASSVAHGIHYTVLAIGLGGLLFLLAPGRTPARRRASVPADEHARRVIELRRSIAAGTLTADRDTGSRQARPRVLDLWLPLAVVSTAAAAGVHAAVGPAHFREQPLFGLFFAVSALAQVGWSVTTAVRASDRLLVAGALGNACLIALWLVTRTVGLPGLLSGPEAVGAWDLACVGWELLAVVACLKALGESGTRASYRLEQWPRWDVRARSWAVVSVVGLCLLSISGAGS